MAHDVSIDTRTVEEHVELIQALERVDQRIDEINQRFDILSEVWKMMRQFGLETDDQVNDKSGETRVKREA